MTGDGRKYFAVDVIEETLKALGDRLTEPVNAVLIGGGAMSFKHDKEATKDVDMVVCTRKEFQTIVWAAGEIGFHDRSNRFPEYKNLNALILVNEEEFQIDLFQGTICRRFTIHDGIIKRSEHLRQFGLLNINLLSDEDLFLSKSVTERELDLADMYVLYLKGLDHDRIMKEMEIQNTLSETIWEAFLYQKLFELEKHFNIIVPWKEEVEAVAIQKMEQLISNNGNNNRAVSGEKK